MTRFLLLALACPAVAQAATCAQITRIVTEDVRCTVPAALACPETGPCYWVPGCSVWKPICLTALENQQAEERYAAMGGTP